MWYRIQRFDWILLAPIFFLFLFSLLSLYSLSPVSGDLFLKKQMLWIFLGMVAMVLVSFTDYRIFRSRGAIVFVLYALSVVSLGLVLLIGSEIRGVEGWFRFGDILLQPVEFLKIILIILLAKYFSRRHVELYRWRHIGISGAYIVLPVIFLLLQPDLGSVAVIIGVWMLLMIFSGIPWRRLLTLAALFSITALLSWHFVLAPYQKTRIVSFLDPWADARGGGYQTIQSMIAVGTGALTGQGIGYGTQSHLHFLPEPETDFIFATFAEEWGFVGSTILLFVYAFFFWRLLYRAQNATNNFARFFILGFLFLVFIQFVVHIGANIGVLPITGLTLPFMSYGGSSMLSLFIGLGIIQSIKINESIQLEEM